jgi:hypothetical protein
VDLPGLEPGGATLFLTTIQSAIDLGTPSRGNLHVHLSDPFSMPPT